MKQVVGTWKLARLGLPTVRSRDRSLEGMACDVTATMMNDGGETRLWIFKIEVWVMTLAVPLYSLSVGLY